MYITILFTIPMIAWFLAIKSYRMRHYIQKPWAKLWKTRRAKPFDCTACMSFWLSLGIILFLSFPKDTTSIVLTVLTVLGAMIYGHIVEQSAK